MPWIQQGLCRYYWSRSEFIFYILFKDFEGYRQRSGKRNINFTTHAGWTQTNRFVMNLWHQRRIFHKRAPSVCLWRTLSCYHSRRKHMFGLQNVCQISLVGYHFRYPKDVSYYLLSLLQLCLSSLAKIVKKVYS